MSPRKGEKKKKKKGKDIKGHVLDVNVSFIGWGSFV